MARERGGLMAPAPGQYSSDVSERLEAMVGVDPRETLEKLRTAQDNTRLLRQQLAFKKAELSSYKARYGFPSHWEHERKALLARLSGNRRIELGARGEKVTESALDEYAHGHSEYRSFLEVALRDRQAMERLDAEVAKLHDDIETAKGVETYFAEHVRLNNGLIYHSAREAALS